MLVSVQGTPGKQGFGTHLLNCVTVMRGPVASVCMPRGQKQDEGRSYLCQTLPKAGPVVSGDFSVSHPQDVSL